MHRRHEGLASSHFTWRVLQVLHPVRALGAHLRRRFDSFFSVILQGTETLTRNVRHCLWLKNPCSAAVLVLRILTTWKGAFRWNGHVGKARREVELSKSRQVKSFDSRFDKSFGYSSSVKSIGRGRGGARSIT